MLDTDFHGIQLVRTAARAAWTTLSSANTAKRGVAREESPRTFMNEISWTRAAHEDMH